MKKICFIGGGVSSCFCSINIKKKDINNLIDITIIEKDDSILKKLLKTGNGQCNYFNKDINIDNYFSSSNVSILDNLFDNNYINKVYSSLCELGICSYNKEDLIYPLSRQAKSIRDLFVYYLNKYNINIECNCILKSFSKYLDGYLVNDKFYDFVIFGCGSPSYNRFDFNIYNVLNNYVDIIEVKPSLVPLVSDYKYIKNLDGVREDVYIKLYVNNKDVKLDGKIVSGQVQFTDYGVSGICIFNLSNIIICELLKNNSVVLGFNFIYDFDFYNYISNHGDLSIYVLLCNIVNDKIVNIILKELNINKDEVVCNLRTNIIDLIYNKLVDFRINITNYKSFDRAQASSGGVSLNSINNKLEAINYKNLFFTGEILDIVGICGGYNLAFAFISSLRVSDVIIGELYD